MNCKVYGETYGNICGLQTPIEKTKKENKKKTVNLSMMRFKVLVNKHYKISINHMTIDHGLALQSLVFECQALPDRLV